MSSKTEPCGALPFQESLSHSLGIAGKPSGGLKNLKENKKRRESEREREREREREPFKNKK